MMPADITVDNNAPSCVIMYRQENSPEPSRTVLRNSGRLQRRKKKNKNTVENLSTRDNKLELVESKMANDGYISMWV